MADLTVTHSEIPVDDAEKLKRFYMDLFGWRIEKVPGSKDYWLIETVLADEK